VSTYCATAFWEALSIPWVSATLAGQAVFAGLNVAAMFGLVFAFDRVTRFGNEGEGSASDSHGVLQPDYGSSLGVRQSDFGGTSASGDLERPVSSFESTNT
jgi:hypothetical protein